jgi:NADPH-dependent 2,4-dienoyl-CoA reductase/sulfur reductase-like enzyme
MTNRQRRHPAQASRVLAAGLSTATLLAIVATLGAAPSAGTAEGSDRVAPAKVAVVIRLPSADTAGGNAPAPQAGRTPDASTRPS